MSPRTTDDRRQTTEIMGEKVDSKMKRILKEPFQNQDRPWKSGTKDDGARWPVCDRRGPEIKGVLLGRGPRRPWGDHQLFRRKFSRRFNFWQEKRKIFGRGIVTKKIFVILRSVSDEGSRFEILPLRYAQGQNDVYWSSDVTQSRLSCAYAALRSRGGKP